MVYNPILPLYILVQIVSIAHVLINYPLIRMMSDDLMEFISEIL